MRYVFALFFLFITSTTSANDGIELPIIRVVDGDTIETSLDLPAPLNKVYIRIIDIDTPESNHLAKCLAEKNKGMVVKIYLTELLKDKKTMTVYDFKWDKYGGRINGTVFVDYINVGELLVSKGYAKNYYGHGDKPEWCGL